MSAPTGCICDQRGRICPACLAWAAQGFGGAWTWPKAKPAEGILPIPRFRLIARMVDCKPLNGQFRNLIIADEDTGKQHFMFRLPGPLAEYLMNLVNDEQAERLEAEHAALADAELAETLQEALDKEMAVHAEDDGEVD